MNTGACLHFLKYFASKEREELQNNVKAGINEQKLGMNVLWLEIRVDFLSITAVRL